jgi:hypothetical protein
MERREVRTNATPTHEGTDGSDDLRGPRRRRHGDRARGLQFAVGEIIHVVVLELINDEDDGTQELSEQLGPG